jgi:hypothetical protein
MNTSFNEHFLDGPVNVHYREVLLYNETWSKIFIINLIINYLQNINIDMELKNESDIIYERTTDLEVGDK